MFACFCLVGRLIWRTEYSCTRGRLVVSGKVLGKTEAAHAPPLSPAHKPVDQVYLLSVLNYTHRGSVSDQTHTLTQTRLLKRYGFVEFLGGSLPRGLIEMQIQLIFAYAQLCLSSHVQLVILFGYC